MRLRRSKSAIDLDERLTEATVGVGAPLPPPSAASVLEAPAPDGLAALVAPAAHVAPAEAPTISAVPRAQPKVAAPARPALNLALVDTSRAVMSTMEVRGDPPALLRAYDEYERERATHPSGLLVHLCVPTSSGIAIHDIWETEVALEQWLQRTPDQPRPQIRKLHNARFG